MKMMRLKSKCGKNLISGKLWSVCGGIFIAIFALVFMMNILSVKASALEAFRQPNEYEGYTYIQQFKSSSYNNNVLLYTPEQTSTRIYVMFRYESNHTTYGWNLAAFTFENGRYVYNTNPVNGSAVFYDINDTLYSANGLVGFPNAVPVVNGNIDFISHPSNSSDKNDDKLRINYINYLNGEPFTYPNTGLNIDYNGYSGNPYNPSPEPPADPEYKQDLDLGYLLVNYKQAYNTEDEEGYIDVTYSQYTTTGVDLSQNGYGVATQIEKNYIDNSTRTVSRTMFIPVVGPIIYQLRKLRETATGVLKGIDFLYDSEQFFEDEEKSALTSYNIILRPYYYDGQDYTYGGATVIENVDVDKVGTRMLKNFKEVDGDDVSLNQTTVYNTDFNYEITQETTYNNNEITINRFNENTYYSYTIEGDMITDNSVTNIDNSTTTINNYNDDYGGWGDLDYQFDPIETKDNIKGLLGVLVLFVPHVKNLFAYLPSWALNTFSTVFSLVAAVAVIKFLGPLAVKLLTTLVTGGTVT